MSWRPDILQHAFSFERAVVTPYTFATILIPAVFSYYLMAVLVQLPRTRLYRAALFPVVFWTTLRASMSLDFSWNHPGYDHLNQGLVLGMFNIAMRCTAWVLAPRPYRRLPICKSGDCTVNRDNKDTPTERSISISLVLWDAWDLLINLRGIGWSWSPKMHIPAPYFRVESRSNFFLFSLCRFICLALIFDVLRRIIHSFGPDTFGTPKGGTIFDPSLPPLERYMRSSSVTVLSGITAYVVIEGVFQLHASLFTLLFQQYPSQWPPLFDSPWFSTSLTSFWGRRWHQLFRESFVAVGGKPLERYLGRAGLVIGVFTVSGVLHDVGMRGMGRGGDTTVAVAGFFFMHGIGVAMERAWIRATGKRVGGLIGWLWAFTWFVLWGHSMIDVWARTGLLGAEFCPEAYRPTTLLLDWISQKNESPWALVLVLAGFLGKLVLGVDMPLCPCPC